jgi:hypothetical protein
MTIVAELKDLGFDYEDAEAEFVTYRAHGSNENDWVWVTLNTDDGSVEVLYQYADRERRSLDIKFSEWNSVIIRLLEWWVS